MEVHRRALGGGDRGAARPRTQGRGVAPHPRPRGVPRGLPGGRRRRGVEARGDRVTDSDVVLLLRLVGPRPAVPEDVTARVHAAVHAHWHARIAAKRLRLRLLASGAVLAAGLAAATWTKTTSIRRPAPLAQPVGPPLAFLDRVTGGGVRRVDGAAPNLALAVGAGAPAGAWLETPADGRAAWRITDGVSLRMDTTTRVRVLSASALQLERGAVYVDSSAEGSRAPVEILTALGDVRDVGTQFEVRATPERLEVRVREGRIALVRSDGRHEAAAGMGLDARPDGVIPGVAPAFGPEWAWVEETAPPFALEGRSLEAVVRWAERETGWRIRFSREASARSAARVTLHGSATGLTPSQTLEAVLPTCGLRLRREGGLAWIEPVDRK